MSDAALAGPAAAWYAVIVLMVCYTLSVFDRSILLFLAWQAGLSPTGTPLLVLKLTFPLLYAILGLPFGLLADRVNRRNLILLGMLAVSITSCLAGVARNPFMLEIAAAGGISAAVAALAPAGFSMIADLFPRERLSSAMSALVMAVKLAPMPGSLAVWGAASLLGPLPVWGVSSLIAGLLGVLAMALLLTVREPGRGAPAAVEGTRKPAGSNALRRWPPVVGLTLMMACLGICDHAIGIWGPTFFRQLHGWQPASSDSTLSLLTNVSGCVGLCCGGLLSDRWLRSGVAEAPLRVGLVGLLGALVTLVPAVLVPSAALVLGLLAAATFFLALPMGCCYAAIQMIIPVAIRGIVSAAMLLAASLLGALGAPLVGVLAENLSHAEVALGVATAIIVAGACLAGALASVLSFGPFRRVCAAMAGAQSASMAGAGDLSAAS